MIQESPVGSSAAEWLAAVRIEERRGEMLAAVDLASRGLEEFPHDLGLRHRAVLALARAGATEQAHERFFTYGLDQETDEDAAALRARIAKDRALVAHGEQRERRAARAAELYGAVYAATGGYYPAINAATMSLWAGQRERSRTLAREVLGLLARSDEDGYYVDATEAEAQLLLGDLEAAAVALDRAGASHGGDFAGLASTRRQLRLICELERIDAALLAPLAGPGVAYYCGHIIAAAGQAGRFPAAAESRVSTAMAEVVAAHPVAYAYGALAGGADIMWAEALLAAGAQLNVLLPFAREEFIERSVASCGPGWVERFERCIAAATQVRYATDDAFLGDDVLFRYGGELGMGYALLRSYHVDGDVWQLALWDGQEASGQAGTAIDVGTWRRAGRSTVLISPAGEINELTGAGNLAVPAEPSGRTQPDTSWLDTPDGSSHTTGGRVVRAMLFGDVRGFSKLTDEQLPAFATHVLGAFARVIDRYQADVWHANTWGDALYLVITDALVAAHCALDLQEEMASIDLAAVGLPEHLALRLGAHAGPVFPTRDPVLKTLAFMGSHVSRTARIEPVTPPGAVYVTEALAAALTLTGQTELNGDYVGHMAAAKGYGRLRMYRLRRADPGDERVPR